MRNLKQSITSTEVKNETIYCVLCVFCYIIFVVFWTAFLIVNEKKVAFHQNPRMELIGTCFEILKVWSNLSKSPQGTCRNLLMKLGFGVRSGLMFIDVWMQFWHARLRLVVFLLFFKYFEGQKLPKAANPYRFFNMLKVRSSKKQ